MTTLTENPHAFGFMLSEAPGNRSRDAAVLAAGNLKAGAVLGKVLRGSATTSGAGNTGAGTITMDATNPIRAGAKVGAYKATCIATAAGGGTFRVEDPDGFVLGDVAVGGTFDDDIKFVIADGDPDFVLGDKFTITIAAGSGQYKELAPTAQDGTEIAAAILGAPTDASSAAAACAVVARDAEVNASELQWFSGATTDQKTAALAQLASVGIIAR